MELLDFNKGYLLMNDHRISFSKMSAQLSLQSLEISDLFINQNHSLTGFRIFFNLKFIRLANMNPYTPN